MLLAISFLESVRIYPWPKHSVFSIQASRITEVQRLLLWDNNDTLHRHWLSFVLLHIHRHIQSAACFGKLPHAVHCVAITTFLFYKTQDVEALVTLSKVCGSKWETLTQSPRHLITEKTTAFCTRSLYKRDIFLSRESSNKKAILGFIVDLEMVYSTHGEQ